MAYECDGGCGRLTTDDDPSRICGECAERLADADAPLCVVCCDRLAVNKDGTCPDCYGLALAVCGLCGGSGGFGTKGELPCPECHGTGGPNGTN